MRFLRKWLFLGLLTFTAGYLLWQGYVYYRVQYLLPQGMTIAGIDVSGLNNVQADEAVRTLYLSPIILKHREQDIPIDPTEVDFEYDWIAMLTEAEQIAASQEWWKGYLSFVLRRPVEPVNIELIATHDDGKLTAVLTRIANFLDDPAVEPHVNGQLEFVPGKGGFYTDTDASFPLVRAALYQPTNRAIDLVTVEQSEPAFNLSSLESVLVDQASAFGGITSLYFYNLNNGDEISINAEIAMTGTSLMKIPILTEVYRRQEGIPFDELNKLINDTIINSGNFSANMLLRFVSGADNNGYVGADVLTESMKELGLSSTYIVTPYSEAARAGRSTLETPANTSTPPDLFTDPDDAMQTTAGELGSLLSMVYFCSQGSGGLLAVYPTQYTPAECQAILDVLALNVEGNLIRYGVPHDIKVSHKHGWVATTHGDAGVVFSPNADFVLVAFLSRPDTNWLDYSITFPLIRTMTRTIYNFYNPTEPYVTNPLCESIRFPDDDPAFQDGGRCFGIPDGSEPLP